MVIELVVSLVVAQIIIFLVFRRKDTMSDKEALEFISDQDRIQAEFVSGNDGGFSVVKLTGVRFRDIPAQLTEVTRDETYQLFINGIRIPERIIVAIDARENPPNTSDTLFKIRNSELGFQLDATDEVFIIGSFVES